MATQLVFLCTVVLTCVSTVPLSPVLLNDESNDDNATITDIRPKWFNQKLDHFNTADSHYWKQRYYVQDTHYKPNGPVFLFIGGESALGQSYLQDTAWLEHVKEFQGIGFAVEHRFYGQSRPTTDLSTDNLQYLSIEQAQEDLALFVVSANKEYNLTNNKWIALGVSYSGMLAAFVRYKFPHLINGAVADSAPMKFKEMLTEQDVPPLTREELEMVPGCYDSLAKAFAFILNTMKTPTMWEMIKPVFHICELNLNNPLDRESFLLKLMDPLINTFQFSDNSRNMSVPNIYSLCTRLTKKSPSSFFNLLDIVGSLTGKYYVDYIVPSTPCENVTFAADMERLRRLDYDAYKTEYVGWDRRWIYQACTQTAFFISAESANQAFGTAVRKEHGFAVCQSLFGMKNTTVVQGVENILMNYGGPSMHATRVVYTQGSLDLYKKYGFTSDPNPGSYAIVIQDVGHGANSLRSNFGSLERRNNPSLKHARMRIKQLIGQWIGSSEPVIIG